MIENLKKLFFAMGIFFIFNGLLLQSVSARTMDKSPLTLKGHWKEGVRSIYPSTIPLSAFINDGVLSIYISTQRSNITVCISKDGEILYEESILALETDYVTIDLSDFDEGSYSIEFKNQWGDQLWGKLELQE